VLKRSIGMVKIIKLLLISAMSLMLMLGCCKEPEPTAWVVTKNMVVYKDFGNTVVEAFNLDVGDICILGREEIDKVFLYTEVLCPDKGYGWVIDSDFKIINKTTIKG
jgi:hypothetical protein